MFALFSYNEIKKYKMRKNMEKDRKIRKTKRALHQALLSLLEEKDLEKITVTQLCERADINRSTFYVYYAIPQDCFHEMAQEVMDEMVQQMHCDKVKTVRDFFEIYFKSACSNKVLFRTIHRTNISNVYIVDYQIK